MRYFGLLRFIGIAVFCFVTLMQNPVFAQEQDRRANNPGHKFVRGVGNVLSGWLEIPLSIYNESLEETPLTGMTVGLIKGIGNTIARTCVGIYETATFPFPFPEDYRPIMDPEFAFQKDV